MIEAGLNVVSALVILEQQTDDVYLASVCCSRITKRADDVQAGLDHGGELPGEDLERLRLDLLERRCAETAPLASSSFSLVASRPRTRSCSRAEASSGACNSPAVSIPAELIALKAYAAISRLSAVLCTHLN